MNDPDETICRLCLEDGIKGTMLSLYDDKQELSPLGETVAKFIEIKVKKDNFLPPLICKKCHVLLNQAMQFKIRCEENSKTLKDLSRKLLIRGEEENNVAHLIIQEVKSTRYATKKSGNEQFTNTTQDNSICNIKCEPDLDLDDTSDFNLSEEEQDNKDKVIGICTNRIVIDKTVILSNTSKPTSSHQRQKLSKSTPKGIVTRTIFIDKNKIVKPGTETCDSIPKKSRFFCEHCGKNFSSLVYLQKHLVGVHKDYTKCKVYKCKSCPFKAHVKKDLTVHNRSHTGERPYVCDTCGQAFSTKGILLNHTSLHLEKNIPCTHCDKKFHSIKRLNDHVNCAHIRRYKYECHLCGEMYAKTTSVRKHLNQEHGIAREKQGKIKRVILAIPEGKSVENSD